MLCFLDDGIGMDPSKFTSLLNLLYFFFNLFFVG